jgi:hypothetical protein
MWNPSKYVHNFSARKAKNQKQFAPPNFSYHPHDTVRDTVKEYILKCPYKFNDTRVQRGVQQLLFTNTFRNIMKKYKIKNKTRNGLTSRKPLIPNIIHIIGILQNVILWAKQQIIPES